MKRGIIFSILALTFGLAGPSNADTSDEERKVRAKGMFDEAVDLLQKGNYAVACRQFEEVIRLVPEGVGAYDALGDCNVGRKRLASAYTAYQEMLRVARIAQNQKRINEAERKLATLKQQVAWVRLDVPVTIRALKGFVVQLDGAIVDLDTIDAGIPVNRGVHEIAASAPGWAGWKKEIDIPTDGIVVQEKLAPEKPAEDIPGKEKSETKKLPEKTKGVERIIPKAFSKPISTPEPRADRRIRAAIAVTSIGGLALLAGAGLGVWRIVGMKELERTGQCDTEGFCDWNGLHARLNYLRMGDASTVLLAGGGLWVAGSILSFAIKPKPNSKTSFSIGPNGLLFTNQF
jgi:hypothetical protein